MLQNLTQGKRLIFLIIGAFVLLGAIAVTIYQVQRSQESRSRADSAPPVTVKLEPSSSNVNVGEQVTVNLMVNAGTNDIGAASGTIDFSNAIADGLFEFVSFSQNTLLPIASPGVNKLGTITFIGTNTTITPVTGDTVNLGKLILKAIKPGTGRVTMKVQFTATGRKEFVPLANTSTIETNITIGSQLSPTPDCRSGVNMVNGCQCYRDEECASNTCRQVVAGNDAGYCVTLGTTPTIFPSITPTSVISVAPSATPIVTLTPTKTPTPTYSMSPTPSYTPTPSPSKTPTPTAYISPTPSNTPTPTAIPTATPTLIPSHTALNVALTLPGIGAKTASNNDNPDPKHKTRSATIRVYNSTDVLVKTVSQNLSWDGKFYGSFDLGTGFVSGPYRVTVSLNNTLFKQIGGITLITSGQANVLTSTTMVTGDINQNNRMDTLDYNLFVACYQGKPTCTTEQKALADFNDNGEFDIFDNAIIVNAFLNVEGD